MSKQKIRPEGGVPNSRYRRAGDLVYISGLVPEDDDGFLVGDDVTTQTRRCFERISEVLSQVGGTFDDVVKMNVFLAHAQRDFAAMNAVFRETLSEPYPARSTVGAEIAAPGILVEIEAVAHVPEGGGA
jgi:2-iminobutanoate/2-iminopropanoate deaminase